MTQESSKADLIQNIHISITNNDIDSLNNYRIRIKEANISWDSLLFMEITPLLRAISVGNSDIIQMLFNDGSDINLASKRGKNAFSYTKSLSIKKLLLKHTLQKKFSNSQRLKIIEDLIDIEDLQALKAKLDSVGNDLTILERNFLLFAAVQLHNDNLFILITHNLSFDQLNELIYQDSSATIEIINYTKLAFTEGKLILTPIITPIAPDGDCMYMSIITKYNLMHQDQVDLVSIKKAVADFLTENISLISNQLLQIILDGEFDGVTNETLKLHLMNLSSSFKEELLTQDEIMQLIMLYKLSELYINAIRKSGNWGDNLQLTIISKLLGFSVVVHNLDGTTITINNTGNDTADEVHLMFNNNHYDLISGFIYSAPHILHFIENLENESVNRAIDEEQQALFLIQHPEQSKLSEPEVVNILGAAVFIGYFMHLWESLS